MQRLSDRDSIRAVKWEDNSLILLDQRELPHSESYLTINHSAEVIQALQDMVVRGAPAIGIAAAYGFVLAVKEEIETNPEGWRDTLDKKVTLLLSSRPTAVNLKWAVDRMGKKLESCQGDPRDTLLDEAHTILAEDYQANIEMGRLGADYIEQSSGVLTHCNTGSLATAGFGTALGVIRTLVDRGHLSSVFISETRPWLQGSRLTAWELERDNIQATLIADSAAAALMKAGRIDWIIIGADRIAANGDVANKIGSYSHAVNARSHNLKLMVVAPVSSIDPGTQTGEQIEIEDRDGQELTAIAGVPVSTPGVLTYNPVFDITPANLVSVLVTERGIIESPDAAGIRTLLGSKIP